MAMHRVTRHPSPNFHLGSVPDRDPSQPLIVSSDAAKHPANKANPTPIEIHNGISPTREKVSFTINVVPGEFLGSHYMKIAVGKTMYNDLKKDGRNGMGV